ncbi:hypothetical protein GQS_07720 [Thermococcus sp. 4557]|uniref:antitoxin family protein n=1 Tax=Thermococcus sp. (strain CGMCC 1.5172 / 4557) TaxID=1042877 RepID=UPI000219EC30|nr:antitoxin family protein [Thermococcus sp. 4557]AEK73442.1 hypothetical protein GQS_07720 [Thermococcus sp. 4557]
MGTKIIAVYENGVLRPKNRLDLPAGTEVELVILPSLKGLMKLFEGVDVRGDVESALKEARERKLWE